MDAPRKRTTSPDADQDLVGPQDRDNVRTDGTAGSIFAATRVDRSEPTAGSLHVRHGGPEGPVGHRFNVGHGLRDDHLVLKDDLRIESV